MILATFTTKDVKLEGQSLDGVCFIPINKFLEFEEALVANDVCTDVARWGDLFKTLNNHYLIGENLYIRAKGDVIDALLDSGYFSE